MNEVITIRIDGRFLVYIALFIYLIAVLLIRTINVHIENYKLREKLGIPLRNKTQNFVLTYLKNQIKGLRQK
ncbi:MAG: hypothetical protein Kow0098_03390 [Ignavibacteriaceae bacterium]